MSSLLKLLRKANKTGAFESTPTDISYPTGFYPLDFRNGYFLDAYNEEGEIIARQRSVGVVSGSINTVIGKPGTAKTTFCVQACMNIARKFPSSFVQHYDLEGAFNFTRVKTVTGMKMHELKDKYVLKKDQSYLEDIYKSIMELVTLKRENAKEFKYNTGMLDEFGNEIIAYEPTFILIDSIPSIAINGILETEDLQTQAYGMQKSKALSDFIKNIVPICKELNLIVFFINHINVKIEMSRFATQAQTMYLKQDEALPGGNAPIYYANNIFKNITRDKFTKEKHGFDGFLVQQELIKSRTNKAGQIAELIYDQEIGFDNVRALLRFAESFKLTTGNNPNRRFIEFPDIRYSSLKFTKQCNERPELRDALFKTVMPYLDGMLSNSADFDNTPMSEEEIFSALSASLERDEGIKLTEMSTKVDDLDKLDGIEVAM